MKKHPKGKRSLSITPGNHVDEQIIRNRAYEFYVDRGMEDGRELEDWLRAEEEVTSKGLQATAA
jgi:hypothetical protein